ncbi:hypothetical protein N657DRAFT_650164 [Parathielavia appendiculata]|uniref:Uncharacterized protein n=1 Tax=Parathielavia appendiculata TaxID=2587402 RepID=A0AAN6TRX4_9PEZI|nr:hypothetical protein N657DRAFT_650164 [Parathielavia appendiculata]
MYESFVLHHGLRLSVIFLGAIACGGKMCVAKIRAGTSQEGEQIVGVAVVFRPARDQNCTPTLGEKQALYMLWYIGGKMKEDIILWYPCHGFTVVGEQRRGHHAVHVEAGWVETAIERVYGQSREVVIGRADRQTELLPEVFAVRRDVPVCPVGSEALCLI